jgi:PleD family two-component response regulator
MVEATKFPVLEARGFGHLTVSCGVSEYPSFSSDGESLVRTADEALAQVREHGGNRVCLATAPEGFQIDFSPQVVPVWGGLKKGGGQ